jgi:hypothetical protein
MRLKPELQDAGAETQNLLKSIRVIHPYTTEDITNPSKFVPKNGRVASNMYGFTDRALIYASLKGGIVVDNPNETSGRFVSRR